MRLVKRIILALIGIALLIVAIVYAGSEWILRRGYDAPMATIAIPRDPASIAEGGRIARIAGCRDCHGAEGSGKVFVDNFAIGTLAPPALARAAARYNDDELVRAIRHGVRKDGSALFIMPTGAHGFLADDDTGRIVAWLRTLKPLPTDSLATTHFGPVGRAIVLAGGLKPSARIASFSAPGRPADIGRYLVDISCTGCHALHEAQPSDDGKQIVPALAPMGAAYDPAAFRTLLRTGIGMDKRDLGLMRAAAIGGLHALNDQEIVAIQAFLIAEAARVPPQ